MGVVYSLRSSFDHPSRNREDIETLGQQWMSLIVAHPHIACAERVPEI